MHDLILIKELQAAFSKSVNEGILDLDKVLIQHQSFRLLRLEDLYIETKGRIPPFRQSDFIIVFVKHGSGMRTIGHYSFPIHNSSLAIIAKRVIHSATYTSPPVGYFLSFNPDFLLEQAFPNKLWYNKRVLKPALQPFMAVNETQAREMTSIFEKMIEECNSGFEGKKLMVALKLLELLLLCDRYFTYKAQCESTLSYSALLEQFNELLEHYFTKHRNVHFYAQALHTHPNNLNYLVKKATGLTAKQTITNRLIIEAKYLLVSTTLTVKEIAYELGFEDPNYFHSFFKKVQHTTPMDYRSQPV